MSLYRYFRRIKKSTTFKTHFFSALCRSVFTNGTLIFVNSVFVKTVGGKSYSQLFFFASLASLIYYTYFAIRGDREAFGIYKAVLVLALITSILCCLERSWTVLEPFNQLLLYLFGVTVMVVDLIGTTLGPIILQLSVNPAIFREVYQKIVTSELLARISAAGLIWIFSVNHWLTLYYPVAWLTLVIHFVLFSITIWRLPAGATRAKGKKSVSEIGVTLGRSAKFIFSNQMVRAAMSIMIWGHVTKFVVELLFYQAADHKLDSATQVASFVSAITMTMILLSLFVQHVFGKKLTDRLQLSTLFTFQPVNILVLGCLALVLPPFWPLVLLMVTYNIINRSIQLPVSRQLLIPVPRTERSTIVSLICILMSVATLIASGAMAALKGMLHLQDFLVILLVLGTVMFFLITGLDSYYIQNLWRSFREARSGRWQDEPLAENFSSVELEASDAPQDAASKFNMDLKSHPILGAYAGSYGQLQLLAATKEHRRLLLSDHPRLVLLALRICFIAGFPWFTDFLSRSLSHKDEEVREFARIALKINEEFRGLSGYSSIFKRKIKTLALEFFEDVIYVEEITKLKSLLKLPDHNAAEAVVVALSDIRFMDLRQTILACIHEDFYGIRLSLQPIIDRMYSRNYATTSNCRHLLEQLSFGRNRPEILASIEKNLASLKEEKVSIGQAQKTDNEAKTLERFMHTLFAEEYRLCPQKLDRALTDTIGDFQSLSLEDSAMLIDMHLEFLKRSELFSSWKSLMA